MFSRIAIAAAALAAVTVAPAHAIPVTVYEGLTNGQQIRSNNPDAFIASATASATFNYSDGFNFVNLAGPTTAAADLNSTFGFSTTNIQNYSGSGTVVYNGNQVANYATLGSFLSSSASAAIYAYASYYTFDLGVQAAGTRLTITHDDGISVYQGTTRIGNSVTGGTGAVTDTILITNTADTVLRYTRQNSTPSVLQVSVPEPMSLGLLGAGLAALGLVRRRKA